MKIQVNAEHIYIHVPFCKRICDYCDFFKINISQVNVNFKNFFNILEEDFTAWSFQKKIKTVYVGGGTPNSLSDSDLESFLKIIKKYIPDKVDEFTFEVNPELISRSQLVLLTRYGVNRLSIGIQSTNVDLLEAVNRNNGDLNNKLTLVKEYFSNFSFDFIYNLVAQTKLDISKDIELIKKFQPTHISWYSLILKENTPLFAKIKKLDMTHDYEFYKLLSSELTKMHYTQYEVSNFCKAKKFQSQHNICYWTSKYWIGIGPSACGFYFDDLKNKYYLQENSKSILNWNRSFKEISERDFLFQYLMMGLRLKKGINIKLFENQIKETFKTALDININLKYLSLKNGILKATSKGYLILNDILEDFL